MNQEKKLHSIHRVVVGIDNIFLQNFFALQASEDAGVVVTSVRDTIQGVKEGVVEVLKRVNGGACLIRVSLDVIRYVESGLLTVRLVVCPVLPEGYGHTSIVVPTGEYELGGGLPGRNVRGVVPAILRYFCLGTGQIEVVVRIPERQSEIIFMLRKRNSHSQGI